jgi:hypothetical protein
MGKGESTFNNDNKYPSSDSIKEDLFEQSKEIGEKKYPSKENEKEKKYPSKENVNIKTVHLKHNRSTKKELHIGRQVYTFWGYEELEVPIEVINHTDFQSQRKYFLIKEV